MLYIHKIREMVISFAAVYVGGVPNTDLPLGFLQNELKNSNEWDDSEWFSAWELIIDDLITNEVLFGEPPKQYDGQLYEELYDKYKYEIEHTIKERIPQKDYELLLIPSNREIQYAEVITNAVQLTSNQYYVLCMRVDRISEVYACNDKYPFDILELFIDTDKRTFREVEQGSNEFLNCVHLFEKNEGKTIDEIIGRHRLDIVSLINKRNNELMSSLSHEDRVRKFGMREMLAGRVVILKQKIY